MKKSLVSLVAFILCFVYISCACADTVIPYTTGNTAITTTLSVGGGSGSAVAQVKIMKGYSASTTMRIQKNIDGTWATIKTVSGSTTLITSFSAESGYSYRAYVTCCITQDATGDIENLAKYSSVQSY